MKPATIKTAGYLISTVSVLLLGLCAWPGASRAGLIPALVVGMLASIGGMALRWYSYEMEKQNSAAPSRPLPDPQRGRRVSN